MESVISCGTKVYSGKGGREKGGFSGVEEMPHLIDRRCVYRIEEVIVRDHPPVALLDPVI